MLVLICVLRNVTTFFYAFHNHQSLFGKTGYCNNFITKCIVVNAVSEDCLRCKKREKKRGERINWTKCEIWNCCSTFPRRRRRRGTLESLTTNIDKENLLCWKVIEMGRNGRLQTSESFANKDAIRKIFDLPVPGNRERSLLFLYL